LDALLRLDRQKKQGALFVDVRSAGEFAIGNAPGTVNIPLLKKNGYTQVDNVGTWGKLLG
jgi:phage shock protein E